MLALQLGVIGHGDLHRMNLPASRDEFQLSKPSTTPLSCTLLAAGR
jgi:hypothetical protein